MHQPQPHFCKSLHPLAFAISLTLALATPVQSLAASPAAETLSHSKKFTIPAQPLQSALLRFGEQSGVQISFEDRTVQGLSLIHI